MEQQARGAHNLNLVTPTHYVPQIIVALDLARAAGFSLPVIYNTNGYETEETIQALAGYIDIYLPDLKYYDDHYAVLYSQAPGYFDQASRTVAAMVAQVGRPVFAAEGIMRRGVIIRHLLLPGRLEDAKRIAAHVYHRFGNNVYLSLMNQYTPLHRASEQPKLNRTVPADEYRDLIDYALSLGVENGFIQEGDTADCVYIPEFDLQGI